MTRPPSHFRAFLCIFVATPDPDFRPLEIYKYTERPLFDAPRSGLAKPFRAPPSLSAVACSFSKRPRPKVAHASSVFLVADWRSHFEPKPLSSHFPILPDFLHYIYFKKNEINKIRVITAFHTCPPPHSPRHLSLGRFRSSIALCAPLP